jgi:23S rRNA pseudouridine2605 synthase
VTELGTRVDPKLARVEVDGNPVLAQEPTYIVMNKPDEVVSSAEESTDPRGRSTVVSLLGGLRTRVVPVGRLDFHTRGVLLLTNDGALHAALLHPRRAVPKTYHVKFQGKLGEDELAQLHAGVRLEDGTRTRPSLEVEIVKATTTNTWVQLTISQGLNRQVRRMGDAIGHSVLKLIRVAFAGITGDGLREGQWRHLKAEEVAGLYALAGLQAPAREQEAPAPTARGTPVVRTPTTRTTRPAAQAQAPVRTPARTPTRTPTGTRSARKVARKPAKTTVASRRR